jgi:hypothetical protein
MSGVAFHELEAGQPLVAVLCGIPMVGEAVAAALDSIAEVRRFPAGRGDTTGLLSWLRPDAVVVDTDEEATGAARFARETGAPLVHVSLEGPKLRVLRGDGWEEVGAAGGSAEALRNVVVGAIFGRGERS